MSDATLPVVIPSASPELEALCGLTPDDWLTVVLDLLPRGVVWPRERETTLAHFWLAICDALVAIQGRDCDLLAESYPCGSTELLSDWERVVGLPDECIPDLSGLSLTIQRQYVCARLATIGGQSATYYMALAAMYGFSISIIEQWPWQIGEATLCDGMTVGNPGNWWIVSCSHLPITYITVGCWQLCDELYTAAGSDLLECIIRRAAPAHTIVTFSYTLIKAIWNKGRFDFDAWH